MTGEHVKTEEGGSDKEGKDEVQSGWQIQKTYKWNKKKTSSR